MDRDFRVSFQEALLENNKLMHDVRKDLAVLTEVIGKDEKSGIRKIVCQHEKDMRGEDNKPGLWTIINRISWTCAAIVTVGGTGLVVLFQANPDAIASFLSRF